MESDWDTSEPFMAALKERIKPIEQEYDLRQVLADCFKDCRNLPISGGWGYSESTAIRFEAKQFKPGLPRDFVPLERHIALKIAYVELIVSQPRDDAFSHIQLNPTRQALVDVSGRRHDVISFDISCWSDWHWNRLKKEWEGNDFGDAPGFDRLSHEARREAAKITYSRTFWFDIADVFGTARHLSS